MNYPMLILAILVVTGSFGKINNINNISYVEKYIPDVIVSDKYIDDYYKNNNLNIDISDIITIGKEVWDIIEKGKPVINYTSDWGGVVPKGINWSELEHFRSTKWGPFGWNFKDTFKIDTVKFSWNFGFNCKGSYNGHGSFLTGVTTAINEIYSAWGFTVNVRAVVGKSPTNYGTKIDPIVGLPIEVILEVKTVLQSFVEKCTVIIKGDCTGVIVSY